MRSSALLAPDHDGLDVSTRESGSGRSDLENGKLEPATGLTGEVATALSRREKKGKRFLLVASGELGVLFLLNHFIVGKYERLS